MPIYSVNVCVVKNHREKMPSKRQRKYKEIKKEKNQKCYISASKQLT